MAAVAWDFRRIGGVLSAANGALSRGIAEVAPGMALCLGVTVLAYAGQALEARLIGDAYLEALVLAILIGTALRTVWTPPNFWRPGIAVSAKLLLEIAVTLLGASVTFQAVMAAGPSLLIGIVAVVAVALAASFGVCHLLGLPWRMAVLVACGNSICGNSAIAAVAPVIGARAEDIASSIAFTAILGVAVVIGLPLMMPVLGLSPYGYGVLAGLTVYAVPQVLAATVPVGVLSTQVGTLVKLVRVLMLGPLVLALSLAVGRVNRSDAVKTRLKFGRLVPWFIIGFIVLAVFRSLGFVPEFVRAPVATAASLLTVVSMAALGLGVDVRVVGRVGARATLAVTASLVVLGCLSVALIYLLGLA